MPSDGAAEAGGRGAGFAADLERARRGEALGYNALFRCHAPAVLSFVRARGVDDPDGTTNEVFLGAFRGLHRFDGDEPAFRSWVFAIARNKVVDALRHQARRPPQADGATAEHVGGDAECEAMARVGDAWVCDVLASLTEDQRDVLLLRVVSQLTIEEIATALGKPVGAVKALQRRGMRTLQRRLAEEGVPL